MIGVVDRETEAGRDAESADGILLGGEAGGVGVTDVFDAWDESFALALEAAEADAAGVGQGDLGGIEDLEQRGGGRDSRQTGNSGVDLVDWGQEIGEQDNLSVAWDGDVGGQSLVGGGGGGDGFGEAFQTGGTGEGTAGGADQADMLPGAEKKGGEGEKKELGALGLFGEGMGGAPAHGGGGVAPEVDGLGGFPLGLAEEPAMRVRTAGFG